MGFGDESLARFLRSRWDQVQVEQLGASGKAALLGRDEGAVLLRLTVPDALMDEAARDVDFRSLQEKPPLLFEMHIGPPQPQP
jgi:hypothetical protein